MIKAVCFDFYNTLATFAPSREELQQQVLREFGLDIALPLLALGYPAADRLWAAEQGRWPLNQRAPEERERVYVAYEQQVLRAAGVNASDEIGLAIFRRLLQVSGHWKLYDDVLPALEALRARRLTTGVISNVVGGLQETLVDLGLAPLLDVIVTSDQVGVTKPHPRIFEAALQRAGVDPAEALFVGDQPDSDVAGARAAGMQALLLDRDGAYRQAADTHRMSGLEEVLAHLDMQP